MHVERDVTVENQVGIHLRVASQIVKLLNRFNCDVEISFNGRLANGKSIMSITQLMAPPGSVLHVKAVGEEAARAVMELDKLFRQKFGED
ncbi:MAG: HPr family phosphocarrier protein [Candidatus Lernaella stagnicola]|nr:HPr family phosphocarrier protein [Candidatus Lernaella stagnicola]